MEYSIKKVFIDVFGERELRNALGSDSHNIEGSSDKLHTPLIKFKDKFLIDIFGDIGGPRTPNSINNFFHKNNPKWRGMTDHVQNALVKDTEIFHKFQDLLTKYKNKYPIEYGEIFQNRKEIFSIFHKEDILRKDKYLHERDSFYYDTVNGQFLDKDLQNIIKKLSVMDDENAFEYMIFLFVLISIFHDTLSSNAKLQSLYNEKYIVKVVPNFPLASTEMLKKEKDQQKLLSSPKPIPKTIYGRDKIIDDVAQQLKENHIVFLYGIGGIGKTQIAKNYVKKYSSNYDTIIYGTYPNTDDNKSNDEPNNGLKELLLSEDVFAFEPKMNRRVLSDGSLENDDDYAKRRLRKVKDLSNERTLIIIDNFDVMNDKLLSEFINGRYHLLITTRCSHKPMIKVKEIEDINALKQIFFKNYRFDTVTPDDAYLEELIELVNRHTYTIELLAKHMSNSCQTTLEMIALLKKEGIVCLNEEIRNDDYSTEVASENLKKMFKIFGLSDEEKQILRYMCLMPLSGVKKSDFKRWAGLKSPSIVTNLIDRSWIIENTNGIALHPIIKDVIMYEQGVTFENCKLLLDNLIITFNNTWSVKPEERAYYGSIAKSLYNINHSIGLGDTKLYFSILYMFEHLDYYDLCEELLAKLCIVLHNKKTLLTAGYYYYAGDYQLQRMNYKQALKYLEESRKLFKELSPNSFELAYVTKHIAHTYHAMYDHKDHSITIVQEAKNYLEQSRKIFETCGIDRNHPQMGSQWFAEGLNFYHLGDYDKAEECSKKSLKIYMKLNGKINSDTTAPMRTLARIYSKQNKIDGAIEMQQDVIAIRGELWGKNQFKYFEQLETLSDIYVENNMIEKGVEALEDLLKIMEERIDDYKFYYNSIKEKLHKLRVTT